MFGGRRVEDVAVRRKREKEEEERERASGGERECVWRESQELDSGCRQGREGVSRQGSARPKARVGFEIWS